MTIRKTVQEDLMRTDSRTMALKMPGSVKNTSPVTENHNKNGYVNCTISMTNFIMRDNNHDTKYTNKNDTNNHDARDLHE